MATVIRDYRPEDRAAAKLIYFRAIREGTVSRLTASQRAAWAPGPDPDLSTPDKLLDQWCWMAEEGGQPTGFMSLCPNGLLDMAFVVPEAMGTGTAGALYDMLLAKAQAEGLTRLTVVASEFSRGFLCKRGWQIDREGQEDHHGESYHISHMSLSFG
jgi:putative acetyltransferase